jgi:hypothetical protein
MVKIKENHLYPNTEEINGLEMTRVLDIHVTNSLSTSPMMHYAVNT